MKNSYILFFAVQVLLLGTSIISCKNEQASKTDGQPAGQAAESPITGQWVNAGWWQALKDTKSPKKAADRAAISSAFIHQDSSRLVADVSYNWHEGMQYWLQPNGNNFDLINPYDKVKAHEIVPLSAGTMRLDSFDFVRLDLGSGGDPAVAAAVLVLGGSYTDGSGKTVEFRQDGTVTGLDDYKKYNLVTDYVVDEIGSDQLTLDRGNDQPYFYAFHIEGNQLTISYIEQDESIRDYAAYKVGKPKVVLTKAGQ